MENYLELKKRQQREVDTLPIKWAFSNKQFEQVLKHFGLTDDDMNLLIRIPGGGFMLKTNESLLDDMFSRHDQERQQAIEGSNQFCFEMLDFELSNHEYIITGDVKPALDAVGLSLKEVDKSERLQNALRKAIRSQRDPFI